MAASPLARKVLALPYDEREALIAKLLESLHGDEDADIVTGEAWDRSWAEELETRLADLDAGRVETVAADRVLAEMHAGTVPARR